MDTIDQDGSQGQPIRIFARRFSVQSIMVQTAVAGLFFVALMQESEWWTATLVTVTIGIVFNQLLAVVFGVGIQRAYGIGHTLAAVLLPISTFIAQLTLPFLLTREAASLIENFKTIDEQNFVVVASIFWIHLACRSSGYLATRWYLHRSEQRQSGQAGRV